LSRHEGEEELLDDEGLLLEGKLRALE